MTRTPSPQQQALIDFPLNGHGSVFGEAVAGAGKTTTAMWSVANMKGSVAVMAFNKKAAIEFGNKARELGLHFDNRVRFGTCHSFGFGGWRYVHKNVKAGPDAVREKEELTAAHLKLDKRDPLRLFVPRLISFAKQRALGLHGSLDDENQWYDIIEHFDMAFELEDDALLPKGVELAIKGLKFHREIAPEIIDFDDMIYMPIVTGIRIYQNDWVVGDEWQDANAARRALVRKMLKPQGRAMFIGDRHQAIYGFCHPPRTKVLTPQGQRRIETLKKGDQVISVNTRNDVAGWRGGYEILDTTVHYGWDWLLDVRAAGKKVRITPHHRLPVKVDCSAPFITYVMRRAGKFRVGYMAMYANAGKNEKRFMLSQRAAMEGADAAWILMSHENKFDALIHEASLHKRGAFGGSFTYLSNDEIDAIPQEPDFYEALLLEHGRLLDFPLWVKGKRQHFERNVPFITEACNIVPGMRVQTLGPWDKRRRGRSRHMGKWEAASITRVSYDKSLPTHGITVRSIATRDGYSAWPLYVADGVIVHNTGADNDSIDITMREFNCSELPLTVSYRCPQTVVAEAQKIVSHIQAHDGAAKGEVTEIDQDTFLARATGKEPGLWCGLHHSDAVLCRKTRPLVQLAFTLIRAGVACHVEGKDIGAGLIKLIDKYRSAKTLEAMLKRLEAYGEQQHEKLKAKGKDGQAEALADRIATIVVIAEKCASVDELKSKIASMFEDGDNNLKPTLTLSTVHKSKGREWPRVFILGRNVWMPGPWARQEWEQQQEQNLIYVAVTRAQRELIFVNVPAE